MFSTDQHRRQRALLWRALPFIAPSLAVRERQPDGVREDALERDGTWDIGVESRS